MEERWIWISKKRIFTLSDILDFVRCGGKFHPRFSFFVLFLVIFDFVHFHELQSSMSRNGSQRKSPPPIQVVCGSPAARIKGMQ
jgi:hypothetical protein